MMPDKSNQIDLKNGLPSRFSKLLYESTIFVAIATTSLYFVGFGYYLSFFRRLSIPNKFLGIQTVEYFIVGFPYILILSYIVAVFFLVWSKSPRSRFDAFKGNLIFFIIILILLINIMSTEEDNLTASLFIGGGIFVMLLFTILTIKKLSMAYFLYESSLSLKILFLLIVISGCFFLANLAGDNDAKKLIQGEGYEIQLSLKDKTDTLLLNKTLMLVMQHDDKYYVVEKNESAQRSPQVYIIPSDQIEIATVRKVNR